MTKFHPDMDTRKEMHKQLSFYRAYHFIVKDFGRKPDGPFRIQAELRAFGYDSFWTIGLALSECWVERPYQSRIEGEVVFIRRVFNYGLDSAWDGYTVTIGPPKTRAAWEEIQHRLRRAERAVITQNDDEGIVFHCENDFDFNLALMRGASSPDFKDDEDW